MLAENRKAHSQNLFHDNDPLNNVRKQNVCGQKGYGQPVSTPAIGAGKHKITG